MTIHDALGITKKVLALGAIAFGGLGVLGSVGTAAADGVAATPMPPAVIDNDGYQNYDTSSYPATPSYPAASTWPGHSSQPCCSR